MSHAGCRSSGVLDTATIVSKERCKLISVHVAARINHSDNIMRVQIYDEAAIAGTGTELARIEIANGAGGVVGTTYNIEYDMHGVVALNGLTCLITNTSASGNDGVATASVEFA